MNNENNLVLRQIEIDNNHITNFPLETSEGTKRIKDRFHKNAVNERNAYINRQKEYFNKYEEAVFKDLLKRVDNIYPSDLTDSYNIRKNDLVSVEELVKFNNKVCTFKYKLGFDFLLSSINENISLAQLNDVILKYIEKFNLANINLKIDDFKYSMFTEMYMSEYLNNCSGESLNSVTKVIFEQIYFECPDIITHLKRNLEFLLKKYSKELIIYCDKVYKEKLSSYDLASDDVIKFYVDKRISLEHDIFKDEFYNLNLFLDKNKLIGDYLEGSPTRVRNYNEYVINGDFSSLNDVSKSKYIDACKDMYSTLGELKEYYRYEEIIKDLIKKFKDRTSVVSAFNTKEKEINNEEKNRLKVYKEYLKASGVGFLAKKSEKNLKIAKMKMNEQIKKIDNLYKELNDMEISIILDKNINDASSIYDLFVCSSGSYSYLEKQFVTLFGEEDEFDLEKEFERYYKFLYSPYNNFMRKVNGLIDYDISLIISDKYKLLGLNVTSENVNKDNINQIRDTLGFIKFVEEIDSSNLCLKKMNFIYNVKELKPDYEFKFPLEEEIDIL